MAEERKETPSDFFKQNPKIEHDLYKVIGNTKEPIRDVKLNNPNSWSTWPDYEKINNLYSNNGGKPYNSIHNHPVSSYDLSLGNDSTGIPTSGDLVVFLRGDEVAISTIYQHNPDTNETEGIYVIRKTKETPKSGIEFCKIAKGCKSADEAESKLAEIDKGRLYRTYELGEIRKVTDKFFNLMKNPQHTGIPESEWPEKRQKALNEIAEQMHLQIKYISSQGFYYKPGIGFLKEEDSNHS